MQAKCRCTVGSARVRLTEDDECGDDDEINVEEHPVSQIRSKLKRVKESSFTEKKESTLIKISFTAPLCPGLLLSEIIKIETVRSMFSLELRFFFI